MIKSTKYNHTSLTYLSLRRYITLQHEPILGQNCHKFQISLCLPPPPPHALYSHDNFSLHFPLSQFPKHTNVYKTVTRVSFKSKWFVRSPEIWIRQSWLYIHEPFYSHSSFNIIIQYENTCMHRNEDGKKKEIQTMFSRLETSHFSSIWL